MHTYTYKHACKHIHTHLHMPVHAHTSTYVYALAHTNTITMHLHMHAQSHMYRLVLDTHTYVSVLLLYLLRRYFSPDFCSSRYVCSAFCRASVWVLPGVGSRNTCCTKLLTFPLLQGVGEDLEGQQEVKDYVIGGQTSKVFSCLVVDFHLQGVVCKFLQGNHAPATRSTLTIQWIFLFSFSLPVPAWKW